MLIISGYDNDLYNEYLSSKKGWEKVTIKTHVKNHQGTRFSRTEVLWKNANTMNALRTGRVPIRLSAREKKLDKINPERKYPKKP